MKILAIDTSTEACSAALLIDKHVTERFEIAPREHAQLILPMIDDLLTKAGINLIDLDAIAFGRGPGAFTGLRIAAGVVQGVAFAFNLPVVPISSLAAIAQAAFTQSGERNLFIALDARMSEVYYASYTVNADDRVILMDEEKLAAPQDVQCKCDASWFGAGPGWHSYSEILEQRTGIPFNNVLHAQFPRASVVAHLAVEAFKGGLAITAEQVEPTYLRNEVAWKKQ